MKKTAAWNVPGSRLCMEIVFSKKSTPLRGVSFFVRLLVFVPCALRAGSAALFAHSTPTTRIFLLTGKPERANHLTAGTRQGGSQGSGSDSPACWRRDRRRGNSARRGANCRRGARGASPYPAQSDSQRFLSLYRSCNISCRTNHDTIPRHSRSCHTNRVHSALTSRQDAFCPRHFCYASQPPSGYCCRCIRTLSTYYLPGRRIPILLPWGV